MSETKQKQISSEPVIHLPHAPSLHVDIKGAVWITPDGEIEHINHKTAARRVQDSPPLICNAPAAAALMKIGRFVAYDVLELFAFTYPAQFVLPTALGLANFLQLDCPKTRESYSSNLLTISNKLLFEIYNKQLLEKHYNSHITLTARAMGNGGKGWLWALPILKTLNFPENEIKIPVLGQKALDIWSKLPEFSEKPPEKLPIKHQTVKPEEAKERLGSLLENGNKPSETRQQQTDYASGITHTFWPPFQQGDPHTVLAEAGTGVGKTLGYLAPATVWAEKNQAPVWISTFTRNLQNQIDDELTRLYPDPDVKAEKVVIRKGRENYLCLLNLEEASGSIGLVDYHTAVGLGLMARWAGATRDGDMVGGDMPGWLIPLATRKASMGLADRRGECIHNACSHYHRCFIERSFRKAKRADIVIANHALVMINTALNTLSDDVAIAAEDELFDTDTVPATPSRFIFDEGHHLFDAADSAFSSHLTGIETAELRQWLIGMDGTRKRRARGLQKRLEGLYETDPVIMKAVDDIMRQAVKLPKSGWQTRLKDNNPEGAFEQFLSLVRQQVFARSTDTDSPYSIECYPDNPIDGLLDAAKALDTILSDMQSPINRLLNHFNKKLVDEADEMDSDIRRRIESVSRGLARRAALTVSAWRSMLKSLDSDTPPEFVDWFMVDRIESREMDVGYYRHTIDPTKPFMEALKDTAHGVAITSATLRDQIVNDTAEEDWQKAERLTGTVHLPTPAYRVSVPSPFNYAEQTRVIIINDVPKTNTAAVAGAYRALFEASGGGALGIFTAIQRLKAVHEKIVTPLASKDIPLYAQHMDGIDASTLVDLFRADEHSCLLGTDALRDGVDVPGNSLRLMVMDRVPWPRPHILHVARREAFGGRSYDEEQTRRTMKQAFGRLIRKKDDIGVFVLLDSGCPSRFLTAFPAETPVLKVSLGEACNIIADFLK